MPDGNVAWTRFWIPQGTMPALDEGAYLSDPMAERGRLLNPDVVTASSFDDLPCVILLGQTSMGKTTAVMHVEREETEARAHVNGGATAWHSLGSYSDEGLLVEDVFRSSVADLAARGGPVYLYLDDFDECLLRVQTLPGILIRELQRLGGAEARAHLRLRVVCRSSVWPTNLTRDLRSIWGHDGIRLYELAPLRLDDVRLAATEYGVDPDQFFDRVRTLRVQAFASRPQTLRTLLTRFSRDEPLPTTQAGIFEAGCLNLCAAYDRGVAGGIRPAQLSVEERLDVAARVAAAAMFSGREFIQRDWTGIEVRTGHVGQSDLVGKERVRGTTREVGQIELAEVFQTGLFGGDGDVRLKWAHRSYAEYLAARYLVEHNADLRQIRSLIVHPDDLDGRLITPLHETAAWLAGLRTDVFADVILRDPLVLLTSDASGADPQFRDRLVEGLLSRYDAGQLLPPDWETKQRFVNLDHPGLGEQLAQWIADRSKSRQARSVAIEIAERCRANGALIALVQVALEVTDDVRVRTHAARAITDFGDERSRAAMLPLVDSDLNDPDNDLKGYALKATWPALLTAHRLFDVLTPGRPNYFGSYSSFLSSDLVRHLTVADLPLAHGWADIQVGEGELPYEREGLVDDILLKATDALDYPAVAQSFTSLAWHLIMRQHRLFARGPYEDLGGPRRPLPFEDDKRREVVTVLIQLADGIESDVRELADIRLVHPSDLSWLLLKMTEALDDRECRVWARLVPLVLDFNDRALVELVLESRLDDPVLEEETEPLFGAIDIRGEAAKRARDRYHRLREWETESAAQNEMIDRPPVMRVVPRLEAFEDGDLDAWWDLNLELTLAPDSTHYGNEYEPDLTREPGWHAADEDTRRRIVEAAVHYLEQQTPEPEKWIETNVIFRPDWAGYRAMHLLWTLSDPRLGHLSHDIWTRWAPVIVGFPNLHGGGEDLAQRVLVRMAYERAPDSVIATIDRLIRSRTVPPMGDVGYILPKISDIWDDRISGVLNETLDDDGLDAWNAGKILRSLLERGDTQARATASAWVSGQPRDEVERNQRAEAAYALAVADEDGGWETVWTAIQADAEFGQGLVERLAWTDDFGEDLARRLTATQIGALYSWLEHQYPEREDPNELGMHTVTARESVGRFRDGLLNRLLERGTTEAVTTLRGLLAEFPDLVKVQRSLLRGREALRPHGWNPPTPREVLALAESPHLRLIQNTDQLLSAVIESLGRLQDRLQGAESRAAVDLWNITTKTTTRGVAKVVLAHLRGKLGRDQPELRPTLHIGNYWREFGDAFELVSNPKEEILLSDYVKRHLDDDLNGRGVVVNREVQNRPRDITDIRVEAFVRNNEGSPANPVAVIVEVKGCWNRDLNTAMVSQLADRYLLPDGLGHGVYLVFWFDPKAWDRNDPRRPRAQAPTLELSREQFRDQASGLESRGLHIESVVMDASLPTSQRLGDPEDEGVDVADAEEAADP